MVTSPMALSESGSKGYYGGLGCGMRVMPHRSNRVKQAYDTFSVFTARVLAAGRGESTPDEAWPARKA